MDGVELCGNEVAGARFIRGLEGGRFLFSFVMSYTRTCEIPGITIAGSSPETMKFTPPADAEFIRCGRCESVDAVPVTPDGKPTPALLTRVALNSADIQCLAISAGSAVSPKIPFVQTSLPPGGNIAQESGMSISDLMNAVRYGRLIGETLAPLVDCLVIGESIPGGTTTAQAVMRGLDINARSSSSMPENPVSLKNRVTDAALARLKPGDDLGKVAELTDPMIPFVAGMLSSASKACKVMLAGGTQMAAVLAVANLIGFDTGRVAVGTTRYIVEDTYANLLEAVDETANLPILVADPGMEDSSVEGLRAFSHGFAKEGAGAGGCIIAAALKTGDSPAALRGAVEREYARIFSGR